MYAPYLARPAETLVISESSSATALVALVALEISKASSEAISPRIMVTPVAGDSYSLVSVCSGYINYCNASSTIRRTNSDHNSSVTSLTKDCIKSRVPIIYVVDICCLITIFASLPFGRCKDATAVASNLSKTSTLLLDPLSEDNLMTDHPLGHSCPKYQCHTCQPHRQLESE